MRSSLTFLFSCALAVVGSTGCAEEEESSAPEGPLEEAGAPLRFNSGMNETARRVIRDEAAWKEAWAQISSRGGDPKPAKIDFGKHVVVVAATGTRASSGYVIDIESVEVSGDTAVISVVEVKPGDGCLVLPGTTTPLSVFVARRFVGEATFVERTKETSCR